MAEELGDIRDEIHRGFAEMRAEISRGFAETQELRDEMRRGFAEMREEMRRSFAEMREAMRHGLAEMREEMRRGFAEVWDAIGRGSDETQQLRDEMRRGFVEVRAEMGHGFAETRERLDLVEEQVRHNGVLIDATHQDVKSLAEAHVTLDDRVERYHRENDAAHRDTQGLVRLTYRDLRRRIRRVEPRPRGDDPASG